MRIAKRLVGRVMWAGRARRIFPLGFVAALVALGCVLLTVEPTQAAFPGQNGKIAFHHDGDIWTMNGSGVGKTQLTTNYNFEGNPAVSPDGAHIAYESYSGIWVMNADGGEKTNLINDDGTMDLRPTFSPDGQKILFESDRDSNGAPELYTMSATDGSGMTRLTTNTVWDSEADWGPFDTTLPRVVRVTPPNSATGVLPGANVSAAFSEAMRTTTLNKTAFKLIRKGTTTPVPATVTYSPDATKPTLNPASELDSGAAYTATITSGAGDTAGNALPSNETWSFKVR